jgi:D-amino-acid dehydrogenase
MRVLVLGSGVIGVSIAWYLAKAGHQVEVVDRQPAPGLETSLANAGEISPGYASPWAGPGVPLKAIKWLLMEHRPLVIRPMLDPAMWIWGAQMLRNCTTARYEINKARMVRLAEYSRDCLKALRADTGLAYDERMLGTLQLFRTEAQLDAAQKDIAVLKEQGVPFELYEGDGYLAHEPALADVRHKFVGAMRMPGDETGDCFTFTQGLARLAEGLGVTFRHETTIEAIETEGGHVTAVRTSAGRLTAERVVVALGSFATGMLKPLGLRLPVYPVKGYSITVPITHNEKAPQSTIMDETHKVAVTRLGDRIRVGGTAQLSGFDTSLPPERRRTLEFVVRDLFPEGGDLGRASYWTGLRPMTPDGTPVLGPTRYPELFLACGHGTLGWTMAAGTGKVMADLISGRAPDIDMDGLTLARYA